MSVQRRVNFISQQRVDLPDLRSLESAVSNDFDQLYQTLITGSAQGYVLRGFEIAMAGAIGGAASALQMVVASGAFLHVTSSQSGTQYQVPPGITPQQLNSATNTIVRGSFAPNAINYVSLELARSLDTSTSAQVYLWNPTLASETIVNAPRANVLNYTIQITSSLPATNFLPIAIVITDSSNNVLNIEDCRPRLTRLGSGGFTPNPFYSYPWTAQVEGRTENPSSSSSNSINPFHGGDKMLGSLKDWMDAVMSNFQEIKGTTYWYSENTSGSLSSLREDLGNTIITGRGHISHSAVTPGLINWDQDINVRVIGSALAYTLIANPTSTDITLTDDMVAYINLIRGVTIVPALIFTNGQTIVSSVGAIAFTVPLLAGDWIKLGSDTDAGYYKIASVNSLTQITLASPFLGISTGSAGAKAQYAFGSYQASPAPNTNRNIYIADRASVPSGQDVFWLFARSDNSGSIPRVYIRFLGSELQEGDTEEIGDNIPLSILAYMGSPIESASNPQYVSAIYPNSVPQITNYTFGAASTVASNQYFYCYSSGSSREYYVWINKDGTGTDPAVPYANASIEVAITTGQTAAQVAAAFVTAFNSSSDFRAVQQASPNIATVQVINTSAGTSAASNNFNVGGLTVTTVQSGTGVGNEVIIDGDNLTTSIKRLDQAIGNFTAALDEPGYDEPVDVVASGATPPKSITGPIAAGSLITLPNNSRFGNVAQRYTVGKGILQVYLNGQYLRLGVDWSEVGVPGSLNNQIKTNRNLVITDSIEFRMQGLGSGSSGGGGSAGPQGPVGPTGPMGPDAVGGPVAISTKTGNYTVGLGDNVLNGNAALNPIIFTLPSASSAGGRVYYFKKIDSSVNSVTILANGTDLIDGMPSQVTITQYESFMLIGDGAAWWIY